jgi:uncharacterized membrane protein YdjX (TVP38/TMEM64 family)
MDPGSIIALIGVVATLVTAILGGIIRYLLNRLAVAEALVDAKQETIEEQRRQLSEYKITAQIQDRFFSQLPRAPDLGSYRPPRGNDE